MRIVVEKAKLEKFTCPLCGQVEMISAEEERKCSNCGTPYVLEAAPEKKEESVKKEPLKPLWKEMPDNGPKQRMKSGRRPSTWDKDTEICRNCQKAMKSNQGFTCKESCEGVKENDSCNLFSLGTPIGGR